MGNGFSKMKEQFGFEGTKVWVVAGMDEYPGSESTHIHLFQMLLTGYSYDMGNIMIPEKCISADDVMKTLIEVYGGEITDTKIYGMYTEITVIDKKEDAMEWIMSIALMHKLAYNK